MALITPSGTIAPAVYTKIKWQKYETCIPMSLSTAMDRFRAIKVGSDYENFSASYIFGNGGYEWGMYFLEGVQNCVSYGSPRWDLVSQIFEYGSDETNLTNSKYIYNNADSYARANAQKQRFSGYSRIDFYNGNAVANAIRNYGYFMFNFRISNNFYDVGSDGIVPEPEPYIPPASAMRTLSDGGSSSGYSGANHSIALIGLTTKNGKPHWIAQNSWGDWWGDNGYCYIPYDWGYYETSIDWALESYSVYNNSVTSFVPASPTNVVAQKNGELSALVTWNTSLTGAMYTVFASNISKNEWYIKGRTTANSINITFDAYASYKIRVLSSTDNIYSDYSNIFNVAMMNIIPWAWLYPKTSGQGFNITRAEWIAFCNKINEVRVAKGLGSYSFATSITYVDKDKPFYAWIFLQAATAIKDLNIGVANEVLGIKSGDNISAWYFENLKNALNNAI